MTAGPLWVIPSIDPAYRAECFASLHPDIRARTIIVDNSHTNRGVAASWNAGRNAVIEDSRPWLIVCSESMRFHAPGGADFEAQLGDDPWVDSTFGWHLTAFSAAALARTGRFDENFAPAYLEDTDYLIRLHLAGYPSPRENTRPHRWVTVDAHHDGTEHSIRAGLVTIDLAANRAYYRAKWGADEPGYRWEHPFDDPTRDWTYWPEPGQR